jgi:predicted esterase
MANESVPPLDNPSATLKIARLNDELYRETILKQTPRVWQNIELGHVIIRTVYLQNSMLAPKRQFAVFVPYQHIQNPQNSSPVLFFWHGKGESAKEVIAERRFLNCHAVVVITQAHGCDIEAPENSVCLWDVCFPFDGDDIEYTHAIFLDLLNISSQRTDLSNITEMKLNLDWSRFASCGFSNGGLWQSVLTLRFSHVFSSICNYQGGISTSNGSWLPQCAAAQRKARHRFEMLDRKTVPAFEAPRAIPLLIVTGDNDTMLPQCKFAEQCFVEAGHAVDFVTLPGETHRWISEYEATIWEFFCLHFPGRNEAVHAKPLLLPAESVDTQVDFLLG